jgi:hypothetical protein
MDCWSVNLMAVPSVTTSSTACPTTQCQIPQDLNWFIIYFVMLSVSYSMQHTLLEYLINRSILQGVEGPVCGLC